MQEGCRGRGGRRAEAVPHVRCARSMREAQPGNSLAAPRGTVRSGAEWSRMGVGAGSKGNGRPAGAESDVGAGSRNWAGAVTMAGVQERLVVRRAAAWQGVGGDGRASAGRAMASSRVEGRRRWQTRAPGGSKLGVTTKAMILTCQSYHMSPAIHPRNATHSPLAPSAQSGQGPSCQG